MKTICFLGHRQFHPRDLEERLSSAIKENISSDEDVLFLMGRHGDYDKLALSVCRQIRKEYPRVKITVVFTSLAILKKPEEEMYSVADMYDDVDTMIYNIEEEHAEAVFLPAFAEHTQVQEYMGQVLCRTLQLKSYLE